MKLEYKSRQTNVNDLKRSVKIEVIHVETHSSFLSPYQVTMEDKERD